MLVPWILRNLKKECDFSLYGCVWEANKGHSIHIRTHHHRDWVSSNVLPETLWVAGGSLFFLGGGGRGRGRKARWWHIVFDHPKPPLLLRLVSSGKIHSCSILLRVIFMRLVSRGWFLQGLILTWFSFFGWSRHGSVSPDLISSG